MNTDKTCNKDAVTCMSLEDSCMEGQTADTEYGADAIRRNIDVMEE